MLSLLILNTCITYLSPQYITINTPNEECCEVYYWGPSGNSCNKCHFQLHRIDDIDYSTKQSVLGNRIIYGTKLSGQYVSGEYFTDQYSVFYQGKKIENADPDTFEVFDLNTCRHVQGEHRPYAKDKNYIYYEGIPTKKDVKSFREIDNDYVVDKNHVYYKNIKTDHDPLSFRKIDEHYFVDKNHVYYKGIKTTQDPLSFRKLDDRYFVDKNHIYYITRPLRNADPNDFNIEVKNQIIVSNNNVYFKQKLLEEDINHYTVFQVKRANYNDDYLIKTDQAVYYNDAIKPTIDAQSFQQVKNILFKDDKRYYSFNHSGLSRYMPTRIPLIENFTLKQDKTNKILISNKGKNGSAYSLNDDNYWFIIHDEMLITQNLMEIHSITPDTLKLIYNKNNFAIFRTDQHLFIFKEGALNKIVSFNHNINKALNN